MPLPDAYRAAIQQQQRELGRLVERQGIVPLRRLYTRMLDDIATKLRAVDAGTFTESQLRSVLGQLRVGMANITQAMTGQLGVAATQIGIASARATLEQVARLERSLGNTFMPLRLMDIARLDGLVEGQAPSLLRFHQRSMDRYGARVVSRFQQQLGTAITTGETGFQVIERIQTEGDLQWWQAERIARTELAYASNASVKLANKAQADDLGGDLWSRWSEHVDDAGNALDDRVGEDSMAMNGQVAPPGGVFEQPPTTPQGETVSATLVGQTWNHPPNRPNDRAVLTPWRAHWDVPGWQWIGGRRVPVTQRMADNFADSYEPDDG